jgi:hypothetical protein
MVSGDERTEEAAASPVRLLQIKYIELLEKRIVDLERLVDECSHNASNIMLWLYTAALIMAGPGSQGREALGQGFHV